MSVDEGPAEVGLGGHSLAVPCHVCDLDSQEGEIGRGMPHCKTCKEDGRTRRGVQQLYGDLDSGYPERIRIRIYRTILLLVYM